MAGGGISTEEQIPRADAVPELEAAVQLRLQLQSLPNRELRAAARSAGVPAEAMEEAADSDNPRQALVDALVDLIMHAATGPVDESHSDIDRSPSTGRSTVRSSPYGASGYTPAGSEPELAIGAGVIGQAAASSPFKSRDWYACDPADRKVSDL